MKQMTVTAKLDLGGLHRQFKALSNDMKKQVGRKAVEAGSLVVVAWARLNAARVLNKNPTGNLANNIIFEINDINANAWESGIGPAVEYGPIHEFGGIITPRNAKMLHWVDQQGQHHFAKAVHIPARPYMRPAMEEHEAEIVDAVKEELIRGINRRLTNG